MLVACGDIGNMDKSWNLVLLKLKVDPSNFMLLLDDLSLHNEERKRLSTWFCFGYCNELESFERLLVS